jgi:hypothetical protein
MERARATTRGARAFRWGTTSAAVLCLLLYLLPGGWGVAVVREFKCSGPGLQASGADFSVGLVSGSGELGYDKDPVSRTLPFSAPPPGPLTTEREWRWRCWTSSFRATPLLPSVSRANGLSVVVPLWIPAILLGAWAGLLWRAHLSSGDRWRCAWCGYDRRGLAADAACPECGTPATSSTP